VSLPPPYLYDNLITKTGTAVLTRDATSGVTTKLTDNTFQRDITYNSYLEPKSTTDKINGNVIFEKSLVVTPDVASRVSTAVPVLVMRLS